MSQVFEEEEEEEEEEERRRKKKEEVTTTATNILDFGNDARWMLIVIKIF